MKIHGKVNIAVNGDIIEFQSGYCPTAGAIVLEKSLTLVGQTNRGDNRTQNFTNVINGRIVIKNGASVTLQNLWLCYTEEKTNIINCKEGASVSLNNVVLENAQQDGEVYPIIYAENDAQLFLKEVTVIENSKKYMRVYIEHSTMELEGCRFNDCRILAEDAEL